MVWSARHCFLFSDCTQCTCWMITFSPAERLLTVARGNTFFQGNLAHHYYGPLWKTFGRQEKKPFGSSKAIDVYYPFENVDPNPSESEIFGAPNYPVCSALPRWTVLVFFLSEIPCSRLIFIAIGVPFVLLQIFGIPLLSCANSQLATSSYSRTHSGFSPGRIHNE